MKRTPLRFVGLSKASALRRECTKLCSEIVRKRDVFCQACGRGDGVLQTAHIRPKGRYRKLQFALSNLVLLCKACHFRQHHMSYPDQQLFFARIVGLDALEKLELSNRLIQKTHLAATAAYLRQEARKQCA